MIKKLLTCLIITGMLFIAAGCAKEEPEPEVDCCGADIVSYEIM